MSEEGIPEVTPNAEMSLCTKPRSNPKRDIIRFQGGIPTAINLEHVTTIYIEGKRITFEFYTKAQFIDFEDEASAQSVFELILKTWSADVVE